MKSFMQSILFVGLGVFIGGGLTWFVTHQPENGLDLPSPFVKQQEVEPTPLNQYSITALSEREYKPTEPLTIYQLASIDPEFESYLFSFFTTNQKMSGLINIPTSQTPTKGFPVILLLRGYVPPESYVPGMGTKNAAIALAKKGYVTIAPDFFGYGASDPEPTDSWEARFVKPINVIELIKTLEQFPELKLDYATMKVADSALTVISADSITPAKESSQVESATATATLDFSPPAAINAPVTENPLVGRQTQTIPLNLQRLGIWAHSNGGQIALTSLEILNQPIPTTLWAPVTAPFPYSVLFFSDESEDEGKATRKWIAQFEENYDVFAFSLTQHLDQLKGEIQLHHGTLDDAALKSWSDEFLVKVKAENKKRATKDQLKINYYTYPGADHNLQPGWNTAMQRDIEFFARKLK